VACFHHYRFDLTQRARALRKDMTRAERRLWFDFLRGLPDRWRRQKPLGNYVADFYCAARQLVIEIDGDTHYVDRGPRRDRARTAALEASGIRVLRFTNLEVMQNFESVCERIVEAGEEDACKPPRRANARHLP